MENTDTQATRDSEAANAAAERIVRHFQSKGFARITEALILHIRHIAGDRAEVDRAFEATHKQGRVPPLSMYFTIHPFAHYSEFRSFEEAKAALGNDFTLTLIYDIPQVFFEPAPVLADDPLASGTKYDVIMKVWDNVDGCAIVILLNDPDAAFVDYIGTHPGADWQKIMGDFKVASTSLSDAFTLE